MILVLLKYELYFWYRSPMTYFLIIGYFLLALLLVLGNGGYFDAPVAPQPTNGLLHSPYTLSLMGLFLTKALLLIPPVFVGFTLYRDIHSNIYTILFSYPISKMAYLMGKLLSGIILVALSLLAVLIGVSVAEIRLSNRYALIEYGYTPAYWTAFGVYAFPTLLLLSMLVFSIVGWTRNIFAGFLAAIGLLILQLIVENLWFAQPTLLGIFDPMGENAFHLATKDWDMTQKQSYGLPINAMVLYNRLFWMGLAAFVFLLFYRQFDFQYQLSPKRFFVRLQRSRTSAGSNLFSLEIPPVHTDFSLKGRLRGFIYLSLKEWRFIARHWIFILLSLLSMISILFIELKATQTGSFTVLPSTGLLLASPLKIYTLFIVVATFIFSGMLSHLPKGSRMNELIDTTPVPSILLQGSKIGALAIMHLSMLLLFFMGSLSIQVYQGYAYFQLSLYLFHLLVLSFPVLLLWNITSFFVHTLIPNLFIALFMLFLVFFGIDVLPQIGLSSQLVKLNTPAPAIYSDFQGYVGDLKAYFLTLNYWLLWALVLSGLAFLLWHRGRVFSYREWLMAGVERLNKPLAFVFALLLCALISVAWTIAKAEIQDNQNQPHYSPEKLKTFQSHWSQYAAIPAPKISEIDLKLDLFPDENRFFLTGRYLLINQSGIPLDTLLIRTGFDEITTLHWQKQAQLLEQDTAMKYQLYKLAEQLQPNDSLWLDFTVSSRPNTLFTPNSNVLSNGTFLQHDLLPRLEYQFENDSLFQENKLSSPVHYFGRDADYVLIKTKISTAADQIAIAPGELVSEEKAGNRQHFTYQTKVPVKFNFSFHSGRYEKRSNTYQNTKIEIYYLQNHDHNVDDMVRGVLASLEFNAPLLGAYPHETVRIVEFPAHLGKHTATLMANTIPASEKLFLIQQKAMQEDINFPFYVMAHELTHEWFGNELMPAKGPGSKFLTESISEYLTLQIYKKYGGPELAQKFLHLQHERYLKGRNQETKTELPLAAVQAHQEYIAYGKGTLAFNALAQKIGEQQMNAILAAFFHQYHLQIGQYPTPSAFLDLLKNKTPKDMHPFVDELFLTTHYIDINTLQ